MKNYETVFILNPVLSDDQMKDTVEKFVKVLKKGSADVINVEQWGLRKLAYPIQHKSTGFYNLIECCQWVNPRLPKMFASTSMFPIC